MVFACWRLLSVVVCNAAGGPAAKSVGGPPTLGRVRGRSGGRHRTAGQYGYVPLSPVHTSDNVAKIRDIVAENGNIIEATLSKQLLVFNPVAMPPPLHFVFSWGGYKSMGLGTEVSSGVQRQNPC